MPASAVWPPNDMACPSYLAVVWLQMKREQRRSEIRPVEAPLGKERDDLRPYAGVLGHE